MDGVDLAGFWREEEACRGRAFRTDKPRCPVGLPLDDHWLLDMLGVTDTVPYYLDPEVLSATQRRGNDRIEEELGIRPFAEEIGPPGPVRIEVVLGCEVEVIPGGTPWLRPALADPDGLEGYVRGLEELSDGELRARVLPEGHVAQGGGTVWSRGPATVATSVFGTTELMYLLLDEPDLLDRFFAALADLMIRRVRLLEAQTGRPTTGWAWLDDDCALFSPGFFERFCMPVHRRVLGTFAPGAEDFRFQHSDSDMAHLLPLLSELNLHGANFGPKIPAARIRAAMPRTEIHGQIAPFTLRDGGDEAIVAEVRRDFEAVGADGGLTLTTAGSIPAGTSFASIRTFMAAVRDFARYDG